MNEIIFFIICIIFSYEAILYIKIYYHFKQLVNLYNILIKNISNEEIFYETSKKIVIKSFKLFLMFIIIIIPIIIFFLYLKYINYGIYNFILSAYYMLLSMLIFIFYLILRNKFVKRQL